MGSRVRVKAQTTLKDVGTQTPRRLEKLLLCGKLVRSEDEALGAAGADSTVAFAAEET